MKLPAAPRLAALPQTVIAGLDPAIQRLSTPAPVSLDAWVKPRHDKKVGVPARGKAP